MADEISRLVHAGAVGPVLRVVAVVPGPDDEDVAVLDLVASVLLPSLEMLRPVEVVIADAHALQVHDACRADEEVERQVADELAAGEEVSRSVEMRADVQRHRDLLPSRPVEGEVFDPADRRPGIAGKRRRVQREVLGEVEEFHLVSSERCTLPIALRGNRSSVITRFGHL